MNGLKLSVYFGDRDRAHGTTTARALGDLFARDRLRLAVLLRGIEGFGLKHRLQTHRLLSLSEDLPLVWVAVDAPERIAVVAEEVAALIPEGLVTLERAEIADEPSHAAARADEHGAAKITVYAGRGRRSGGRLVHHAVVDVLREEGVDGASVLLGVDGVRDGRRLRARVLAPGPGTPAMTIAVGVGERVAAAAERLAAVTADALVTVERVRLLKRDGTALDALPAVPPEDPAGRGLWQKITVFTGEDAPAGHGPRYARLVRALRESGASGATVLGGVWGYSGAGAPHGDSMLSLRRRVPVVVVAVDRPRRIADAWPAIDRLTAGGGVVTSELVPALRASATGTAVGGLALADVG